MDPDLYRRLSGFLRVQGISVESFTCPRREECGDAAVGCREALQVCEIEVGTHYGG